MNGIYVTGHHTLDFCESLLIHISRGAGKEAFHTLKPIQKRRFLPLVFLYDSELETLYDYLPNLISVYYDESNEDMSFKRNRIRKEILPVLKAENINFHKFYWNFHEWEVDTLSIGLPQLTTTAKRRCDYFQIPLLTIEKIDNVELKRILDFYLSLLGFPPLYRSAFENFREQFSGERAQFETKDYLIYREKTGTIHIIRKDSILFRKCEITDEGDITTITWNSLSREISNKGSELSIRGLTPGEKIKMPFGNKEISEVLREHRIPYFLREHIPIVYKKNLPIQILLSMFDPSLNDYPKSISNTE